MNVTLKRVLCINVLLHLTVFIGMQLCINDHLLNLIICQPTFVIGDRDLFYVPSYLVLSTNIQNSVCVYFEGDLDLRMPSWGGRNAAELKGT
mmetsp:Transcript_73756/g.130527  ORF Transcript_73756/g.130527 Transcript_73756/m.130527 type:complete len:92 (+) Transcript_73756:525-800(+)